MSKDKVSSQEMIDQVAARLSVSKRVAEEFLKSLFAEIEETLLQGEPVKIKNLGTFKMQWNEPRKSVNVQTGEVIIIDGYNKVTFTPDSDLKDAINEPYSHLEPIELDEDNQPVIETVKPVAETNEGLRNLSEQASEIKDILSEINALSPKKPLKAPIPEVRDYEIPDYELILIDEEVDPEVEKTEEEPVIVKLPEPEIVEPIVVEEVIEQKEETIESKDITEEQVAIPVIDKTETTEEIATNETLGIEEEDIKYQAESESDKPTYAPVYEAIPPIQNNNSTTELSEKVTEPFILGKPKKKRKGLKVLIFLIVLSAISYGGFYIAFNTSSCFSCWFQYTLLSEENRASANEYWQQVKGWFDSNKSENKTVTTPPATSVIDSTANTDITESTMPVDTIEIIPAPEEQAVDSFDIAFKNRRNYNEFIGEETISEGTRLTNVAQKYYGKRDFWVYIYEANRDNIVHPDRITPGTVVKVPKVDPKLIDKKNPKCLKKARELHDLYIGKN